jgi:hypothetical protein
VIYIEDSCACGARVRIDNGLLADRRHDEWLKAHEPCRPRKSPPFVVACVECGRDAHVPRRPIVPPTCVCGADLTPSYPQRGRD